MTGASYYRLGGGGACFQGLIVLEQSQEAYTIGVGEGGEAKTLNANPGGDTYINYDGNRLITAGGGRGGAWNGDKGEGGPIYVNSSAIQTPAIKISREGNDSPEWGTPGAALYLDNGNYCGKGGGRRENGSTGIAILTHIYIDEI